MSTTADNAKHLRTPRVVQRDPRTIYAQLRKVDEQHPGLLTDFRDDLHVWDRQALDTAEPGSEYLWLMRKLGTHLVRLNLPVSAESVRDEAWQLRDLWEYMRRQYGEHVLFCHLRVTGRGGIGTVRELTPDEADRLVKDEVSRLHEAQQAQQKARR